jgi:hypothetical protein
MQMAAERSFNATVSDKEYSQAVKNHNAHVSRLRSNPQSQGEEASEAIAVVGRRLRDEVYTSRQKAASSFRQNAFFFLNACILRQA